MCGTWKLYSDLAYVSLERCTCKGTCGAIFLSCTIVSILNHRSSDFREEPASFDHLRTERRKNGYRKDDPDCSIDKEIGRPRGTIPVLRKVHVGVSARESRRFPTPRRKMTIDWRRKYLDDHLAVAASIRCVA